MTPDTGYISLSFHGSDADLAALSAICDTTERQNQYSCGLSWLDDLDCDFLVESEAVSFDTIEFTIEFLSAVLLKLPGLEIEGRLEHCWPVLPLQQTVVEFSSDHGTLLWNEYKQNLENDLEPYPMEEFEDSEEEWEYPTQP